MYLLMNPGTDIYNCYHHSLYKLPLATSDNHSKQITVARLQCKLPSVKAQCQIPRAQ